MKYFYLVIMVFVMMSNLTFAQDTVRISIGVVELNGDENTVEVPVFADAYSGTSFFQFAIRYDSTALSFNELTYNDSLPTSVFGNEGSYNLVREGYIIVTYLPNFNNYSYNLEDGVPLLTLNFNLKGKLTGIFPITFDPIFPEEFGDENSTILPYVVSPGAIIVSPNFTAITIPDSIITDGRNSTCLPVIAEYLPTIASFRLDLSWDTSNIRLNAVILGDNPLGLSSDDYTTSLGQLSVNRVGSPVDTIAKLPIMTEILQLCFTGLADPGGSAIEINQDSSAFLAPRGDTLQKLRLISENGALSFRSDLHTDYVNIAIDYVITDDITAVTCVPIKTLVFNEVANFEMALTMDYMEAGTEEITFSHLQNLHPALNASSFSVLVESSLIHTNYVPTEPVAISLDRGSILFEMCFQTHDLYDRVRIYERSYPNYNQFRQFDSFSSGIRNLPHRISTGGIAAFRELVKITLDTVAVESFGTVDITLTSELSSVSETGIIFLKYPAGSLSFVEAIPNENNISRNFRTESFADGLWIIIGDPETTAGNYWPAGEWLKLRFTSMISEGSIPIQIDRLLTQFRVQVNNNDRYLSLSASDGRINVNQAVSNQAYYNNEIAVYPNPIQANTPLTITADALVGNTVDLQLMDITGRQIARAKTTFNGSSEATYTMPQLPAGSYLIRMTTNNGKTLQRIVLVR